MTENKKSEPVDTLKAKLKPKKDVEVKESKKVIADEISQILEVLKETVNTVLPRAFSIYFVRTESDWIVDSVPSNDGEFIQRVAVMPDQQFDLEATAIAIHKEISDFESKKWQQI